MKIDRSKDIRKRIYLIGMILSISAGIFGVFTLNGTEVGLATLLTIFFTGFGGGASLAAYLTKRKYNIRE